MSELRCRPGDLVVLVECLDPVGEKYLGHIRKIGKRCDVYENSWVFDPPFFESGDGREWSWLDGHMRPIRDPGDDAVDEILTLAGKPQEVAA